MKYTDLQQEQRRQEFWIRANQDKILLGLLVVVFLLGFWVLPALGLYIVS